MDTDVILDCIENINAEFDEEFEELDLSPRAERDLGEIREARRGAIDRRAVEQALRSCLAQFGLIRKVRENRGVYRS